jgi:hypothetical protein
VVVCFIYGTHYTATVVQHRVFYSFWSFFQLMGISVSLFIFMYAGGESELCDNREGLANPIGLNWTLFFPPAARPFFGLAKS